MTDLSELIDTDAETNLMRRGDQLLIPPSQSQFPVRCVMTNRTDDLIVITGELGKLANPKMVNAFLTVASIGVVGGLAAAAVLTMPAAVASLASVVRRGSMKDHRGASEAEIGDAAVVRFAVNKQAYTDWATEHYRRKFWIRFFVTGGLLCLFGSLAAMIAFPTVDKNDPVGFVGVGMLYLGALCAAAAGLVAVLKGQPLLHSITKDDRYISVKGAGNAFLDSLPSA